MSVGALFVGAWCRPFRHAGALMRFAIVPLVVAIIVWPPSYSVDVDGARTSLTDGRLAWEDLLELLVSLPFSAAFAAAWIRLSVTGDEGSMDGWPMPVDRRTWLVAWAFLRLMLAAVAIYGLIFALSFVFFGHYDGNSLKFNIDLRFSRDGWITVVAILASLLVIIGWALVMLRFSMAIPAAAIAGQRLSLAASWRMTKPLQFRLLTAAALLFLAFILLVLLFTFALTALGRATGPLTAFYAGLPGVFVLFVFAHALWAGLLGMAYRALQEPRPETIASVFG
jgi:hypothetical protein